MSRVLFVILAVLAVVLALIFQAWPLYLLAVLLAGCGIAVYLWQKRRIHFRQVPEYPSVRKEELTDLGIVEIRPKMSVTSVPGSGHGVLADGNGGDGSAASTSNASLILPNGNDVDTSENALTVDDPSKPEPIYVSSDIVVRPKSTSSRTTRSPVAEEGKRSSPNEPTNGRGGFPVIYVHSDIRAPGVTEALKAVVSSTSGSSVVLLRRVGTTDQYEIVASVSRNPKARDGGSFRAGSDYPVSGRFRASVVRGRELSAGLLGYYTEPVKVAEALVARLGPSVSSDLLLCDTEEEGAFDGRASAIFEQFTHALSVILSPDTATAGRSERAPKTIGIGAAIEDEIIDARDEGRSLALALVYQHIDSKSCTADERSWLEDELEARVRASANQLRVERFAEMTFAVFFPGNVNEVEDWAVAFEASLDTDTDQSSLPTSVGVAMLRRRHETADDFRSDALAALQEAFESGACTILE